MAIFILYDRDMKELISLYDSALIYYPNVFFPVLFFLGILGIILVCIGIIVLWKKIGRVIEEIKDDLKQTKIKERNRISFFPMLRVLFERKKTSFFYIVRLSVVFLVRAARVTFVRVNTTLGYIESQTERIIKKIGKKFLLRSN